MSPLMGALWPEGYGDLDWLDRRKHRDRPTEHDFSLRVSRVADLLMCQGRTIIPDILGVPVRKSSEPILFGSMSHARIDHHLLGLDWPGHEAVLLGLLEAEGLEAVAPSFANAGWYAQIDLAFAQWQVQVQPYLPSGTVVKVEERLYRPLGTVDGKPVWLRGTSDYAWDTGIIDWKTSAKAWPKGRAERSIQLPLYRSLVEYNYGWSPTWGAYVVFDRKKGRWDWNEVDLPDSKVEGAQLQAFQQARAAVRQEYTLTPAGEFRERAWFCQQKFCPAWEYCPLGGHA